MIQDPALAHLIHTLFETLAMTLGARYYVRLRKQVGHTSLLTGNNYAILLGCFAGAAIGNKLVFWIEMPQLWREHGGLIGFFLGGQSMVGGLLGGLIGVEIAKWIAGLKTSTGDSFVAPVLLGIGVGRVGCFLAGLSDGTFGVETHLPWGVDFGDGIYRHPTQLYEIAYVAVLWLWLRAVSTSLHRVAGLQFKIMLLSYLLWRLFIDGLKPIYYRYPFGLSGIQWVCLIAIVIYIPFVARSVRDFYLVHAEET